MLGNTNFKQAKVEEYLESAENAIIVTGTPIFNMIFGKQAVDMDLFKTRDAAIKDYAKSLDSVLNSSKNLLGEEISLADLINVAFLTAYYQMRFEDGFRKQVPHLTQWFTTHINSE